MVYCLLQNRYMKAAKDWGWREFVTLHTLFDADAGYLLNDDCVFAAEVLMLRESSEAKQVRLLISASVAILVRTLELQTCSLWLLPLSLLFVLRWAKRRNVK
jgi:EamA domain-containing membrane protein RarD